MTPRPTPPGPSCPAPAAKLDPTLLGLADKVAKEGKDGTLKVGDLAVTGHQLDVIITLSDTSKETLEALKKLGFAETGASKAGQDAVRLHRRAKARGTGQAAGRAARPADGRLANQRAPDWRKTPRSAKTPRERLVLLFLASWCFLASCAFLPGL